MKKHWFYLENGNTKEDDAINSEQYPDTWCFCYDGNDGFVFNTDELFETREQARKVAIEYHTKKIEEHEAKLFSLMHEMINEE